MLEVRLVVTFERKLIGKGHKGYFFSFYSYFLLFTLLQMYSFSPIFPPPPSPHSPFSQTITTHHRMCLWIIENISEVLEILKI